MSATVKKQRKLSPNRKGMHEDEIRSIERARAKEHRKKQQLDKIDAWDWSQF